MIEGDWTYASASSIGTSHLQSAHPVCQDFHACAYIGEISALIVVVSDGAGSSSRAEEGAELTCKYVLDRLSKATESSLLSIDFSRTVLEDLRDLLRQLAADAKIKLREFACTMLVAIVLPTRSVFWQIGDGAMCFRCAGEDHYNFAFWPEKGDYANVTFFVTDDSAQERLEFDIIERQILEFASFTDGLERLALDFVAGEVHTAFFAGLCRICKVAIQATLPRFRRNYARFWPLSA